MYRLPAEDLQRLCPQGSDKSGVEVVVGHLQGIRSRIQKNQQFLNTVSLPYEDLFPHQDLNKTKSNESAEIRPKQEDFEKIRSTLRQISREWSVDGKLEREQCFQPLLDELAERFPDPNERSQIKVLNPGCGLGRLTWEIARMGFTSQGNEFSFCMLLTSNAILNKYVQIIVVILFYIYQKKIKRTTEVEGTTIYPYIHSFCNILKPEHQLKECKFPDEIPSLPASVDFSMSAGDFLEVYCEPGNE